MFSFIDCYFKCSDQSFAGVVVGRVMERLQWRELCDEFFVGFLFQFSSKLRVRLDFRQRISAGRCFDIESAASAENRYSTSVSDVFIGFFEISLVLEDIVFRSGIHYVHQMIWNLLIFREILTCAYVHSAVDLTRVGRDYFCTLFASWITAASIQQGIDPTGKLDRVTGLAWGSGSQNAYQVDFAIEIFVQDFLYVYFFSRWEFGHRGDRCERFLCHNDAKIAYKIKYKCRVA